MSSFIPSMFSSVASFIPGFGSSQAQAAASNTANHAAITVEMSEQGRNTAERVNRLVPQEIVSSNALDIKFNGTTQHLVVALTYKGHQAPLERAKLQNLTEATKGVFELTHATFEQKKLALENKNTLTKKEKAQLAELNKNLAILNNISSFSFLHKGSEPYLKVVSKNPNQKPLWVHLDSEIFEDINTLADRHVENEVNRLQTLSERSSLNQDDMHKLDVMKFYLESKTLLFSNSRPEIIRQFDKSFIKFTRDNGQIEHIEIDSRLHPHVGAKHLQIDEFFQNFIQACEKIVENDKEFAKKVGITNQPQQLTIEQQKQLAAAQQQQAMQQAQMSAASTQAAQQQVQQQAQAAR